MRKLQRLPLSPKAQKMLDERTRKVAVAADPPVEAERLWHQRDNAAFEEIRATLRAMAPGIERCMYCEDSAAEGIEHFWPKADYPLKAFDWLNYLLACNCCNSNHKRDRFPLDEESQEPLLIDPTRDDPMEHLELSPMSGGKFAAVTRKGMASLDVFGLNRAQLEQGRARTWKGIERMLWDYEESCSRGDQEKALDIKRELLQSPFSGVFVWFLRIATGPHASQYIEKKYLTPRCLEVLKKHPEIMQWF